jgi:hypothetical protein
MLLADCSSGPLDTGELCELNEMNSSNSGPVRIERRKEERTRGFGGIAPH